MRTWSAEETEFIKGRIEELRPWHYYLDFGEGITTGQGNYPTIATEDYLKHLPADFTGMKCLDMGCNNGLLAFLLRDRKAEHVVGIDADPHVIEQAKFVMELCNYDGLDFRVGDISELPDGFEMFDFIFCFDFLSHTLNMIGTLDRLRSWTKGGCYLETAVLLLEKDTNSAMFIEGTYDDDATYWWIPGIGCVLGMARTCGFKHVEILEYVEPTRAVSHEGLPMQGRALFYFSHGSELRPHPKIAVK
jgi:tRNA (mo5U34)-methyltransferase